MVAGTKEGPTQPGSALPIQEETPISILEAVSELPSGEGREGADRHGPPRPEEPCAAQVAPRPSGEADGVDRDPSGGPRGIPGPADQIDRGPGGAPDGDIERRRSDRDPFDPFDRDRREG